MKVRIIAFSLLFFLSGCDLSFSLGSEKGTFQTDKEMTDFLVENIDAFTSLAESKTECNSFWAENGNDQIVTDECQEIFDSLGLLGILYSSYTKNDGSDELIQWMSFSTYDVTRGLFNGYSKGYRYNYNSDIEIDLWEGDLDTPPEKNACENYTRIVEILDDVIIDKWYLVSRESCD